jgi:hypothetical protein
LPDLFIHEEEYEKRIRMGTGMKDSQYLSASVVGHWICAFNPSCSDKFQSTVTG